MKTFKGHKEFYCSMRHIQKQDLEKTQREAETTQTLATNVLVNGVPPPGTILPPGTAFPVQGVLPNGSVAMPIAQTAQGMVIATPFIGPNGLTNVTFNVPTVIMPPVVDMQNNAAQAHQTSPAAVPKVNSTPPETPSCAPASKDELPLDLSKKTEESSPRRTGVKVETGASPGIRSASERLEPEDLSAKSSSKSPVQSLPSRPSTPVSQAGSQRSSPGSSRLDPALTPVAPHPVLPNPALMAAAAAAMLPQQAVAFSQMAAAAAAVNAGVNISTCTECNIVFYKHENFVIHKEHYCSGRRRKSTCREPDPPEPPPRVERPSEMMSSKSSNSPSPRATVNGSPEVVPNLASKAISDVLTLQGSLLPFFCHPCKITFSSHDTLKAHQEYYCPARGSPEGKDVGSRSPGSSSGTETPDIEGNFPCQYCGNVYTSSRLLKLHYCKANSVHIPLLRCPYCEYITQNDNRLVDHIKAHAPTRAFRCTLCGYRGNTVRGMRMHGKTHLDAGWFVSSPKTMFLPKSLPF